MPHGNILIVDDEVNYRLSLRMILINLGYTVRAAEDGFSALGEIQAQKPEILVCDLFMPRMNGFELLSRVSRDYPAIRTIAVCAIFEDGLIPEGVAAHAFYRKGAGLDKLLAMIEEMSRNLQSV
jgi:CheY-like chemotaxis protein